MRPRAFISKLFGASLHSGKYKLQEPHRTQILKSPIPIYIFSQKPGWATSESEASANEMNENACFYLKIPPIRGACCGKEMREYRLEIFRILCQGACDRYFGGVSGHEGDDTGSSTNILR